MWASFLTQLMVAVIKRWVGRQRPYLVLPEAVCRDKQWRDCSFPSGHTATGFSLAIIFSHYFPQFAPWFYLGALLVDLSRVYLGYIILPTCWVEPL
ncbi:MAG TPA: phosphatase PAP2 family protein [Moorella mulderi]|nr:phosphatase PAP2 family protein [Moorella mulderi]